jgi:hypothetical protein
MQSKSIGKNDRNYLDHSITDYFIYTDLSFRNPKTKEKVNFYNLAIKRGCKCICLRLSPTAFQKNAS